MPGGMRVVACVYYGENNKQWQSERARVIRKIELDLTYSVCCDILFDVVDKLVVLFQYFFSDILLLVF
jgi:hypothetical protein